MRLHDLTPRSAQHAIFVDPSARRWQVWQGRLSRALRLRKDYGEVSGFELSTLNLIQLGFVLVLQSGTRVSLTNLAAEDQSGRRYKLYTFATRWFWYRFGGMARLRGVPGA